jgi:tRNA(Ile2) C34 agmatinyltransferase TiaS
MATTSEQLRAAVTPARSAYTFELVKIVRQSKPTALTECRDCGGTLSTGEGQGFLCTVCSSRWRTRWIPCAWWEELIMCLLPRRYRWQRYRVERA